MMSIINGVISQIKISDKNNDQYIKIYDLEGGCELNLTSKVVDFRPVPQKVPVKMHLDLTVRDYYNEGKRVVVFLVNNAAFGKDGEKLKEREEVNK